MRTLRLVKASPATITIVVLKGSDGRFSYCPRPAIEMLHVRQVPGTFDTVERALDAVRLDQTIPAGSRVEVEN